MPMPADPVAVVKLGFFEGTLTKPSSSQSLVSRRLLKQRSEQVGLLAAKPLAGPVVKLDKQVKLQSDLDGLANLDELLAKLNEPQAEQAKVELIELVKQFRRTELDELAGLKGRGYDPLDESDAAFKQALVQFEQLKQLKQAEQVEQAETLAKKAEMLVKLAEKAKTLPELAEKAEMLVKLAEKAKTLPELAERAKTLPKLAEKARRGGKITLFAQIKLAEVVRAATFVADSAQCILDAPIAAQTELVVRGADLAYRAGRLGISAKEAQIIVEGTPLSEPLAELAELAGLAKLQAEKSKLPKETKPLPLTEIGELAELVKPLAKLVELAKLDKILTTPGELQPRRWVKHKLISEVLSFKKAELAELDSLRDKPAGQAKVELVQQIKQIKQAKLLGKLKLLTESLGEQGRLDNLKVELDKLDNLKFELGKLRALKVNPDELRAKQAKVKLAQLIARVEVAKESRPAELLAELRAKQGLDKLPVSFRELMSEEGRQQVNKPQELPQPTFELGYLRGLVDEWDIVRPSAEHSLQIILKFGTRKVPWWKFNFISASLNRFVNSILSFKEVEKMFSVRGLGLPANRKSEPPTNGIPEGLETEVNDDSHTAALNSLGKDIAEAGSALVGNMNVGYRNLHLRFDHLERHIELAKEGADPIAISVLEQQVKDLRDELTQLEERFTQYKAEEGARSQETANLAANLAVEKLSSLLEERGVFKSLA